MKNILPGIFLLFLSLTAFGQNSVSFSDTAVAHSDGVGLNVSIRSYPSWDFSGLLSNFIPRSTLEHNLNLSNVWKRVNCAWDAYTDDPYQGKQSAVINCLGTDANPSIIRCQAGNIYYRSDSQYELSFALKKDAGYTGQFSVKLGAMLDSPKQDLTTDWAVYTFTFYGTNVSGQNIDIQFFSSGNVYLDDIQLHRLPDKRGDRFSSEMMKLLTALQPATIRWGALTANVFSLEGVPGGSNDFSTGFPYSNYTIADFVNLCNQMGIYSNITIGTASYTDYFKDPTTMKRFVDYLGAGLENPMGALREAEGYHELLSGSKGIVLELGNEVWGSSAHNAPFAGAVEYGNWTGPLIENMKESTAYDESKFFVTISGRDIADGGGWSKTVIDNSAIWPDWIAVSGYMGGNFNYDPSIPFESELNYYKSGFAYIESQKAGVANFRKAMFQKYNKAFPLFLYEGNMTNDSPAYSGKFGQAVAYIDFCAAMIASGGVTIPVIFNMNQGQWRIISMDNFSYRPLPLYYAAKVFNTYCKGTVLKSSFTGETVTSNFDRDYTYPVIDSYVFNDSTRYSVLLINRDYENTRSTEIHLPFEAVNDTAHFTLLSASSWDVTQSADVLISESTVDPFTDGYTVSIPPFSMAVLSFRGPESSLQTSTGFYRHINIDSIRVYEKTGIDTIRTNQGSAYIVAKVYPGNCDIPYYDLHLIENESTAVPGSFSETSGRLKASGTSDGNGIVTIEAISRDNPEVRDTLTIVIINQGPSGIRDVLSEKVKVFPNPAGSEVRIVYPQSGIEAGIKIFDMTGRMIYQRTNLSGESLKINVSGWDKGVYPGVYQDGKTVVPFRLIVAGE